MSVNNDGVVKLLCELTLVVLAQQQANKEQGALHHHVKPVRIIDH